MDNFNCSALVGTSHLIYSIISNKDQLARQAIFRNKQKTYMNISHALSNGAPGMYMCGINVEKTHFNKLFILSKPENSFPSYSMVALTLTLVNTLNSYMVGLF